MNEHDKALALLEARLSKLRPSPVPKKQMESLRRCVPAREVAPRTGFIFSYWRGVAIAATLALLGGAALVSLMRTGGDAHTVTGRVEGDQSFLDNRMVRISSDQYLIGVRKLGVWSSPDGTAYRVLQGVSMNQTVFQDDVEGTELKLLKPQQRVLLMAMATQ